MSTLLIRKASVVGLTDMIPDCQVVIQDGVIKDISSSANADAVQADEVIDAAGGYLAPGFIDLHIHGLHRCLIDNGPDDLAGVCAALTQYGVTGFLPTVCPVSPQREPEVFGALSSVRDAGAQILGFHYEGPFLTLTGAIPDLNAADATPERVQRIVTAVDSYRVIFSIAPDYPGVIDLIPVMTGQPAPVFMTHTKADVKQTQAAIKAGVRHATHFYDVFPVPPETDKGVRPCGAVEAVLADPAVSVDFILDGEHVDPVAVQMALACKGPDRVCLITDSNIGAGLGPGRYLFNKREVEFTRLFGPARMTENTHLPGSLAGSGLTLDQAVRNAVEMLTVDLPQAVRMASANPAKVLGLDDQKGQVKPGYHGDLVLLDRELKVMQTWIAGKSVYRKEQ